MHAFLLLALTAPVESTAAIRAPLPAQAPTPPQAPEIREGCPNGCPCGCAAGGPCSCSNGKVLPAAGVTDDTWVFLKRENGYDYYARYAPTRTTTVYGASEELCHEGHSVPAGGSASAPPVRTPQAPPVMVWGDSTSCAGPAAFTTTAPPGPTIYAGRDYAGIGQYLPVRGGGRRGPIFAPFRGGRRSSGGGGSCGGGG